MKHINNKLTAFILCLTLSVGMTGCAVSGNSIVYPRERQLSVYTEAYAPTVEGFAAKLCVANEAVMPNGDPEHIPEAAGLFDVTDGEVLFAKNIHQQMEPASITKLLTAYVAFKYGDLDDEITVPGNITITEYGAKLSGLLPGDQVTLRDVLYALLIYSGNDAGLIIADYISGDQQAFVDLMNEEAKKLGATNTHFLNPHGLTAEGHVTTVYDLYLIFNALLAYPEFTEIISTKSYTCTPRTIKTGQNAQTEGDTQYVIVEKNGQTDSDVSAESNGQTDSDVSAESNAQTGVDVIVESNEQSEANAQSESSTVTLNVVWKNTNQYLTGETKAPDGVTVIGGKTGTTAAAGSCLIILSTDTSGRQYISVVMHAPDKKALYEQMNDLLKEIVN